MTENHRYFERPVISTLELGKLICESKVQVYFFSVPFLKSIGARPAMDTPHHTYWYQEDIPEIASLIGDYFMSRSKKLGEERIEK